MSDIVERLRIGSLYSTEEYDTRHEAADEIERLRAERDRLIRLAHIAIEYACKQGHAESKGHSEIAAESASFVEQFKRAARATLGED